MFKFKELAKQATEDIANLLTAEHGKTVADAMGEIGRGVEVVEAAGGILNLLKGDCTEQVGTGVDRWSIRQPPVVVGCISPFNFPGIMPMWMAPMAIACGICVVLKSSERDTSVPLFFGLFTQAGAKNHMVIMSDGDLNQATDGLFGARYGSAGERSMAISVAETL
ncbi:MAG: hypothetical protein JWM91_2328 [Rhodospirillales bacterium]|nr:hypothetical protein [Rhodospirillales bacterium]